MLYIVQFEDKPNEPSFARNYSPRTSRFWIR